MIWMEGTSASGEEDGVDVKLSGGTDYFRRTNFLKTQVIFKETENNNVHYNYYLTYKVVKKKIESFSWRFSIFYDLLSEDCNLVHGLPPRNF